jgi:signal transduction histidine kinase
MSLRQRLNRGLALILCIIFVIHWMAADWVIRTVAEKQMATRLTHDSDSLQDTLTSDDHGQLRFDSFHLGSVYNQAFSGHYFVIRVDNNVYYSASLQNQPLVLAPVTSGQPHLYHYADGPKHQPLLVLGRGFKILGHQVSISVAEDLTDINHDITSIRIGYFSLTLFVLLSAIVIQSSNVKRALRPFNDAHKQLTDIVNGEQQQITVDVPSEIKPLVNELNRLLVLVMRRLQHSRTAIGNLAHALKTPLALLFRIAEDPVIAAHPELQQQLQTQTTAIHHCIERELKRARIAGNQKTNMAFNPYQELNALSQLLQNIYSEKQLQIKVIAPNFLIHYDREDLLELIGNLLDNACKWAKHSITVTIAFSDDLVITIEDDGPGFADLDTQLLTQRGLRLDESVHGHGLGLAIVRDITEFYSGCLHFDRSTQLGGFLARVSLPLN